jgi:hypothetical protein
MKIIAVDDLSSALRLYDFNKNIKTTWCLNLKYIISKGRERERERNLGWDCCYEESKTCELCFIKFVSPRINLNHISYFFEGWCHLTDLNHISNALVK